MMRSTLLAALASVAFPMMALAQTVDDLKNDQKTPADVLTYGMGYSQQRFSPLSQINKQNVKRLVPAWSYSMADNRGQEAQPLIKDGVIYLTDHEGEWSDNHGRTRTAFVEGGRRNLCYH